MTKKILKKEDRLDVMDIWQHSVGLLNNIFDITDYFKNDEIGLSAQVRMESYEVMNNITKAVKMQTPSDIRYFLMKAVQTLNELSATFVIAHQMGNVRTDIHQRTADGYRMLERKINRLIVDIKH